MKVIGKFAYNNERMNRFTLWYTLWSRFSAHNIIKNFSVYQKKESAEDTMDLEKRKCRLNTKEKTSFQE